MQIKQLKIKNFRVIKSARIDFPDTLIGIVGPNGAGKSSLVEAIGWALYGNPAARTGKSEIKSVEAGPNEDCLVELSFLLGETPYRLTRRLVGRSQRAEVQLFRGEGEESVGVSETNAYVGELLGLDRRGFETSFMARQQELNALSDLTPAKRRDQIAGMLGVGRLDKALDRVKGDSRELRARCEELQGQLGSIDELKNNLKDLQAQKVAQSAECKDASKASEEARLQYRQAEEAFLTVQNQRAKWTEMKAREKAITASISEAESAIRRLEAELISLEQARERVSSLSAQLQSLEETRRKLESLRSAKESFLLRQNLQKQVSSSQKELDNLAAERARLDGERTRLRADREKIPADIETLWGESSRRLDAAREEFSELKSTLTRRRHETQTIQRQLQDLETLGPDSVCERCHRPLGTDLQEVRKHLETELSKSSDLTREAETLVKDAEQAGKSLGQSTERLAEQKERSRNLEIQIQSLESNLDSIERRQARVKVEIEEHRGQLLRLAAAEYSDAEFEQVKAEMSRLEALNSESERLKGRLDRLHSASAELEESKDRHAKAADNLSQLLQLITELGFTEEAFERISSERKRIHDLWQETRDRSATAEQALKGTEAEIVHAQDAIDRHRRTEKDLKAKQNRVYLLEGLAALLRGFRQQHISSIRPNLGSLASDLISEMTDGRYSLAELDDDYNLRLMDGGEFFALDRFSGGEKDLASLCLRLAISLLLTESAGLSRSFLILDEVFGSQDTERRDLIVGAMGNLRNRFPQIILITHIEELKERIEYLIDVRPTSGGVSEVLVNGTVV